MRLWCSVFACFLLPLACCTTGQLARGEGRVQPVHTAAVLILSCTATCIDGFNRVLHGGASAVAAEIEQSVALCRLGLRCGSPCLLHTCSSRQGRRRRSRHTAIALVLRIDVTFLFRAAGLSHFAG